MAGFHFNFANSQGLFTDAMTKLRDRFARAFQASTAELMFNIKRLGDQDILGAGRFSTRWTRAFTVQSSPAVNTSSDRYVIDVFFDQSIPYAHIHEFGGTIVAKGSLFGPPLLWIPLSFGDVPRSGGGTGQMTAQEYGGSVSPLFRVNRRGKSPLLLDIKDHRPRYFGIASVTLPKRFHIRDICARETSGFNQLFTRAIQQ